MKFQTRAQRAATHPGEPLYTLSEIADHLGAVPANVHGLMIRYPGLKKWQTASRGTSAGGPQRNYYRLSDARLWWATVPEKSREKAKAKMK